MTRHLSKRYLDDLTNRQLGGSSLSELLGQDFHRQAKATLINEQGIYKAIFRSKKPEAEAFEDWVVEMLETLREKSGLEAFQMWRMMDKEHQKDCMSLIQRNIPNPTKKHYIKANVIANKAVSTKFGHKKMVKKGDMTPEMLLEREPILEDTVELMMLSEKHGVDISVSETIYKKHA